MYGVRQGGGVRAVGDEGGRGEEVEAEGEVGRGEDGESFDEDGGYGFFAGEVGVELVAFFVRRVVSVCVVWRWLK